MSPDIVFQPFLETHLTVVEPLVRETQLAEWDLQTTSNPEAKEQSAALQNRLAQIYASAEDFTLLKSLDAAEFSDPLLKRQHTLLRNSYLAGQIDAPVIAEMIGLQIEIEDTFNTYRAKVRGKQVSDNEIEAILMESDDAALRQETWEASKTVGAQVADRVLHLVRLRNREARRLGYDNFYAMGVALQELDETHLFDLLDNLHVQSEALWQSYKTELDARLAAQFGITPDAIRPWHHANPFFQEPGGGEADLDRFFADKNLEALTSVFFETIGLPVDDLLQKADLYEREGKCQHAFCMDVDRKGDVRVLCNCRPNERWASTLLHEFGHAAYDKFCDPALPYLLRGPAHTLTTEAIALFMGRLTKDARWLQRYAGVTSEEARQIAGAAQAEMREHLLVFMRWCFVMAHFERALYRDPEQDLNTLWWDLVDKYQGVVRPENRNAPDWAAKIHLATSPVYYHNYQLGEMVASQLLHYLETVTLAGEPEDALVTSPKVGAYLQEKCFTPGAVRPWEDWLEHATGERLNPAYFVAQLQAE